MLLGVCEYGVYCSLEIFDKVCIWVTVSVDVDDGVDGVGFLFGGMDLCDVAAPGVSISSSVTCRSVL